MKYFRVNQRIDKKLFLRFKAFLMKAEEAGEEHICMVFATNGGKLYYAEKIIEMMGKSKIIFYGLAYREVHSAAIPIFLSTKARYAHQFASSLIHRARSEMPTISASSDKRMKASEQHVFGIIADKLSISLEMVYKMANCGSGTTITMDHPFGRKFFIGN